jgi:hypothetical protein
MTVPCPPGTTLACVLVRYNVGVEGCHKKSVWKGTQEVEARLTDSLVPSTSGVSGDA